MSNIVDESYTIYDVSEYHNLKKDRIGFTTCSDNNNAQKRGTEFPDLIKHPETGRTLKFAGEFYDKNTGKALCTHYVDRDNNQYCYMEYHDLGIEEQLREDHREYCNKFETSPAEKTCTFENKPAEIEKQDISATDSQKHSLKPRRSMRL